MTQNEWMNEWEIQSCKSTESHSLSISDRTFKDTKKKTQHNTHNTKTPENTEENKRMPRVKWLFCPSILLFFCLDSQQHRNTTTHNGRSSCHHHQLRWTQLGFGASSLGPWRSESNRVGSESSIRRRRSKVQADVAGEASDLKVGVHHDTSGAESDVVFGVPCAAFQHEGVNFLSSSYSSLWSFWFFFFFSFGSKLKCFWLVTVKGSVQNGKIFNGVWKIKNKK